MCGIVGYLGDKPAYDILIQGLHRLEYRGYDSSGIAIENVQGQIQLCKTKGKVANLEALVGDHKPEGSIGRRGVAGIPRFTNVSGEALVDISTPHLSAGMLNVKRVSDLLFASLALVVLSPVLAAVALAVKLDSPGPVFYRQRRLGYQPSV